MNNDDQPSLYELPMFPLGSVLFPFSVLPLRIFEDRYLQLTTDVLAGNGEFGVVLIERGAEVGGGDVRFAVATVAKVLEAEPLDDGGWFLAVVGIRRIQIHSWLEDDPYPRAIVSNLDPAVVSDDDHDELLGQVNPPTNEHFVSIAAVEESVDSHEVDRMVSGLRRVLAMRSELNEPGAPATFTFDPYPPALIWQACAVLPVGPLDDLALLRCSSMNERLTLLKELIDDEALVLGNRLSGG